MGETLYGWIQFLFYFISVSAVAASSAPLSFLHSHSKMIAAPIRLTPRSSLGKEAHRAAVAVAGLPVQSPLFPPDWMESERGSVAVVDNSLNG